MEKYLFKAKSLENDNWEIGYLVKNQEWAYIVKPLDNGMFDFITVDPKTVCKFAEIKNSEKGIPAVHTTDELLIKLEAEERTKFDEIDEIIEKLKYDDEIDMYIRDMAPHIAELLKELKNLRSYKKAKSEG